MKNRWLGYLSSAILLMAGILEFTINNFLIGSLFILSAIGGLIVQIIFSKKAK
jgi:hypothetical protein